MALRGLLLLSLVLTTSSQASSADANDLVRVLQSGRCANYRLADADLAHADLRDADLQGAELQRANLGQDRLDAADLKGADLSFTRLNGASLRGADLRGSRLTAQNYATATWPAHNWTLGHWSRATGRGLKASAKASAATPPCTTLEWITPKPDAGYKRSSSLAKRSAAILTNLSVG